MDFQGLPSSHHIYGLAKDRDEAKCPSEAWLVLSIWRGPVYPQLSVRAGDGTSWKQSVPSWALSPRATSLFFLQYTPLLKAPPEFYFASFPFSLFAWFVGTDSGI